MNKQNANPFYRYMVRYTKRIIAGNYSVEDTLRFCDWQSANEFAARCNSGAVVNDYGYGPAYRIESGYVEAI